MLRGKYIKININTASVLVTKCVFPWLSDKHFCNSGTIFRLMILSQNCLRLSIGLSKDNPSTKRSTDSKQVNSCKPEVSGGAGDTQLRAGDLKTLENACIKHEMTLVST